MRSPDRSAELLAVISSLVTMAAAQPATAGQAPQAQPATSQAAAAETRQAYTPDHRFLVKLLSVPSPIPLQRYFSLRVAVYDGSDPHRQLSDPRFQVNAGMAHGLKHGLAHGMQSAPQVHMQGGTAVVSGMFFHMRGEWTLLITVSEAGHEGTARFELPCCGH